MEILILWPAFVMAAAFAAICIGIGAWLKKHQRLSCAATFELAMFFILLTIVGLFVLDRLFPID